MNIKTEGYASSKTCYGILALLRLYKLSTLESHDLCSATNSSSFELHTHTHKKKQSHPASVLENFKDRDNRER